MKLKAEQAPKSHMKQRILDHRTVQDFPKQKHGGKFVVEWDSYGDNDDLKAYYPDMKAEHARFFVLQLCLAAKKMRENFRIYEKLFNLEPSRNCKPNLRRGFAWQRIQRLSSSLFCSDLLETKRRVVLLGEELHSQFKRCEKKGQRKEFQTGVFFIFIAENSRTVLPKINKNMYERKFGKLPIQEISRRKWLKCKPIIAERERERVEMFGESHGIERITWKNSPNHFLRNPISFDILQNTKNQRKSQCLVTGVQFQIRFASKIC